MFSAHVNNNGANQPTYLCSLISISLVHCLDSTIIQNLILRLMSILEQAGLSVTSLKTSKTDFLATAYICSLG